MKELENNMENEFVSYNQALALKELGFDEPCFGYWKSKNWLIQEKTRTDGYTHADQECSAPLCQQAFRWFREKHKLIAYPQWRIDNTWDITIQQLDGYGLLSGQTTLSVIKKSTYEEAEQACLDKLIQIVKNNAHI